MPSKLTGLFKTLTWQDFKGPQPTSNPNNMFAATSSGFSVSGASTQMVDSVWRLADTLNVTITMDSMKSWALPSVKTMPKADQDALLKHEQGHYNVVALLARDMFIELMQLKGASMASSADVAKEVQAIHTRYGNLAQPLQDLYDSKAETDHGRDKAKQTKWEGYITTAFTQARVPAQTAPDGTAYKVEILPLLRKNGLKI